MASPDVWGFEEAHDDDQVYADGTTVPHRHWFVTLNGERVGEVEVHMHKRRGRDKVTDFSVGTTSIVYGPLPGGR